MGRLLPIAHSSVRGSAVTLREARCLFSRHVARLIVQAEKLGYDCALGEVVRDPRIASLNAQAGKGISNSLHLIGLAVDLHLYRDGKYLSTTAEHTELGAWWKAQHPLFRWGGDFTRQDGNHYSMTWEGRA